MAVRDTADELAISRRIADPWYRTQSFARVARYAPDDQFTALAQEAIDAAAKSPDPCKTVGASAWAVRAMLERKRDDLLDRCVPPLLVVAEQIVNRADRSEALFTLFQAVRPADARRWLPIFDALVLACIPLDGWRQGRNLRDAILMVAEHDGVLARRTWDYMPEGNWRRQTARALEAKEYMRPREFFW
jgi:hypothetical protein